MSDVQHPTGPSDPQTTGNEAGGTQWQPLLAHEPLPAAPAPARQPQRDSMQSTFTDEALAEDLEEGLAKADPLTFRPRRSSVALCVAFGVMFLLMAAGAYRLGVHTVLGQAYEDQVFGTYKTSSPAFLQAAGAMVASSLVVFIASGVVGVAAAVAAIVRKRWWLLGQLAVFALVCLAAARMLKPLLPRPFLVNIESSTANSAPSGHVMLAAAASIALVCAVPHMLRALCAVLGGAFTVAVSCSVIMEQWHRPADVVMAMLIAGGVALLAMAFTRNTGMDAPGTRVSSPSVQIVGSALITLGVCAYAYAAYAIWQIADGLQLDAAWTFQAADNSTTALVVGTACLVFGLVLAMRQLTASPLSRLGLIGAPPAPPQKR